MFFERQVRFFDVNCLWVSEWYLLLADYLRCLGAGSISGCRCVLALKGGFWADFT